MSAARLCRRATDRVAAGVASGGADHLNVDPLLVRVMFVGLVLFNGAGFFIYLAAWLFIPVEGRDTSVVEGWIRRVGVSADTAGTVAWILLGVVGAFVLLDWASPDGGRGIDPGFAFALVVIVSGILLLRRGPKGTGAPATDAGLVHGPSPSDAPLPMPAAPEQSIRPTGSVRRAGCTSSAASSSRSARWPPLIARRPPSCCLASMRPWLSPPSGSDSL